MITTLVLIISFAAIVFSVALIDAAKDGRRPARKVKKEFFSD